MRKRVKSFISAVLAALFLTSGCASPGGENPTRDAAAIKAVEGKNLYVVATVLSDLNYFDQYKTALKIAEEELGVSTAFVGPKDYNLEELISIINTLIESGNTYGLILLGWEDALVPMINRAVDSGMYVCTVCQDLSDSRRMLHVGQNNTAVGRTLADLIMEAFPEHGDIVILRSMSLTNVLERIRGLESILSDYPKYQIVADIDTKNDSDIALQKVAMVQESYADADVIIAADGISSAALAEQYRRNADKPQLIICFDSDESVMSALQAGKIDYTIVANTPLEVYLAILEGERRKNSTLQLSADDVAAHVKLGPSYIDTGFTVVNRQTADCFRHR